MTADPLQPIERRLWQALLLCVPVSATPLLPFGNGTLARPLAIVPAALLLILAAYRLLVLGQRPRLAGDGFAALSLFTLYIIISGLGVVMVQPPDTFKGQTPLDSLVRALLTWGVGLAFYVVARLQIRNAADIRMTLRFLFIGMGVSIAFAGVQVVAMAQHGELLRVVQAITDLIAVRYDGLVNRAQGMTFEPSWLATQIIVLLIPALIARAMARQEGVGLPALPGHALRLAGGFAVAIGGLLFSGSRFGLACIVAMLGLSVFLAALRGRILAAATFLGVLVAGGGAVVAMSGLGAGAGATYVMGPVAYLTESADLNSLAGGDVATGVTDALALAGRFAAAEAAGLTWLDHPVFGVSLGNNYRYFGEYAPDWAFTTQLFTQGAKEGIGWLDPNSPEKGNAKNLFLRLLSETGVVGFALFIVFFWRQLFRGRPHDAFHRYFRLASAAALGFSFLNQDTFVDAGLWIPLALCCAMNHLPTKIKAPAGE
ncbi:hypothetical protein FBZ87_11474 [Nitrospirillum amazonense]|uniref:O-antigen ligase n=1 Tax=Nitrospirillum amazonense TaxID=28077 RepID=A0A560J8Y6_9PROT|nr:hypothetical protein [Nitrospirillum amazonense]TWB67643.1 hypothetical protein FBZ87_11474 [Nitrospirillum amazonense]